MIPTHCAVYVPHDQRFWCRLINETEFVVTVRFTHRVIGSEDFLAPSSLFHHQYQRIPWYPEAHNIARSKPFTLLDIKGAPL